jgi:hypothetical protein
MKIIKQENIDGWTYECKCVKCNSELLAEKPDVKVIVYEGDQREPGYTTYYVTCPVCFYQINIESVMIPKLLQVQLKTKPNTYSGPYDR